MKSNSSPWRWFSILAALEAGAAFVALAATPHESPGYSAARLAVLAVLAVSFIVWAFLAVRPLREFMELVRPRYAVLALGASLLLALALFLLRYLEPERLLPYYQRLGPLLAYLLVLSAQFSIWCLWVRNGLHPNGLLERRKHLHASLAAFAVLLAGFLFLAVTRIGLTPDSAYWGEPGVPILGWQFSLALLMGLAVFLFGLRMRVARRLDMLLVLGLWLLAVGIWLSVPTSVMKNSFYAPMNPPANQPFPNSDAGYYDSMAQSLLIGYPYQGVIPTRPLYILFLAFLHLVAGQRYDLIIAGQTLLLALIPAVLFLLGKRLHSRAAGLIVALFAIFREWNSLLISSQTRVSNTKTLLVDLPTLLVILLACLIVVRWLQRRDQYGALLAGGMLGLLLLLRTQSMLLLPIVMGLMLFAYGVRNPGWHVPLALLVVGVAASMAPWLLHNYLHSGQLTLDAPFEYQVIASQYKYTGNLDLNAVDLKGKSLLGILLTFALEDPKFVAGFIASHFSATLIDSLVVLPLPQTYNGLFAPLNLYWMKWPANIGWLDVTVLLAYIAVIAIGLGAAWMRARWAGLIPLAFASGYALANGIGRFSGWRYDLPADWVAYFYLAVGAAELLGMLALLFGAKAERAYEAQEPEKPPSARRASFAALTIAFAIIGALPWFAEGVASPRYDDQTLPKLVETLNASPAIQRLQVKPSDIQAFTSTPQATLEIGRVLYPRFFPRGAGQPSAHPWPAYAVRDFPRVGFLVLTQSRQDAVMALRQSPAVFPQAGDAIILGCQQDDYLEVRLILFPGSDMAYLSAPLSEGCN